MNPSFWCPGRDLTLYLRCTKPVSGARWVVHQGETVVRETRPADLTPGEMERLRIPTAKLDPALSLTVEVVTDA